MVMYPDLNGKTAVITGGDSGLGSAIAERFGAEHMNVVINYNRNETAANETAKKVEEAGGKATILQGDVSQESTSTELVKKAIDTFGDLDLWVNNAGLEFKYPTNEMPLDKWQKVIDINLTGAFLGTKAALNYFLDKNKKGNIINTSSVHQQIPWPTFAEYAASKGGVKLFTETTGLEYAKKNIRINSLSPGAINTPINEKKFSDPVALKNVTSIIPMGYVGKPSQVSAGAAWLASDESSYMTGHTLYIDGGMTLYPAFQDGNG